MVLAQVHCLETLPSHPYNNSSYDTLHVLGSVGEMQDRVSVQDLCSLAASNCLFLYELSGGDYRSLRGVQS